MQYTEVKSFEVTDHFLTGEKFHIVENPSTKILHTQPVPENLDKYYETEDYLSHNNSSSGLFARLYALAKSFNLKSKTKLISEFVEKGDHLDIGAGIGDLVKAARQKGINSTGVEPSSKAREVARRQNVELHNSTAELPNEKFEVISMYHVLEHVPDLQIQIAELKRLLAERGTLILALPNIESYDAGFFKSFWAGYDVPRHLHHFSKATIVNLLSEDFELVKTQPMWFDSFYVSILSARYQKKPVPLIYGLFIGLWSNLRALGSGNASSLTYIFKKRF